MGTSISVERFEKKVGMTLSVMIIQWCTEFDLLSFREFCNLVIKHSYN